MFIEAAFTEIAVIVGRSFTGDTPFDGARVDSGLLARRVAFMSPAGTSGALPFTARRQCRDARLTECSAEQWDNRACRIRSAFGRSQRLTGVSAAKVDLTWLRAATRAFSPHATRMETRTAGGECGHAPATTWSDQGPDGAGTSHDIFFS